MGKVKKLKNEISILFAALMAVLTIVLFLQSALFFYPRMFNRTNDYLQEKNRHLRTFIEGYFREMINSATILAKNIDVIEAPLSDSKAKARALALFKEFQAANPNIYYIYAGYTNNLLLINDYEPPEGYTVFNRPWYKAVMDNPQPNKIVVGLLYREIKTNELLLSTIHILESPRYGITGALAIDSYTENIANQIQEYATGFNSLYSFITDKNFKIIVHPDKEMLEENLLQKIRTKNTIKPGSFIRYSVHGIKKIAFISYLELTEWYIFTTVTEKEIFVPIIDNLILYLCFIAVVVMLFFVITIYEIKKKMLNPLETLVVRVEQLSMGMDDYKTTIHLPGNEIGIIAKNIEALTASALYQKNKELLTKQEEINKINEELEGKNRILENLAIHDALTGVFNRRKLEETLIEEYQKYKRYHIPYSLIIFDIDDFKMVNDTFGHDTGDKVLKLIASAVKENIRKSDVFGRWGGEEFMILLFNTKLDEAVETAEKLRTLIEFTHFPHNQKLTISLGVAEIGEEETLDHFIKKVDNNLYKAKNTGKNKTVWE